MSWEEEHGPRIAQQTAQDLRNLARFLETLGMRAVCDHVGQNRALGAVNEIPVMSVEDAEAAVIADPGVVWVTGGGHYMGTPAREALHRALTPGRLFAVVVRSGLSGSYYGTYLYAYDGSMPGHPLVQFFKGEISRDGEPSAHERVP